MKRLPFIALLALALATAGCGGGGKNEKQGASAGRTVQVKETEFSIAPARVNIAATGTVTFEATNSGQLDHALEIEGNGVEEETETISPGSSGTLTVDLSKAGTYELYCPIDNHRSQGMEAEVVVGGAAGGGGTTTNETTTKSGGYGY